MRTGDAQPKSGSIGMFTRGDRWWAVSAPSHFSDRLARMAGRTKVGETRTATVAPEILSSIRLPKIGDAEIRNTDTRVVVQDLSRGDEDDVFYEHWNRLELPPEEERALAGRIMRDRSYRPSPAQKVERTTTALRKARPKSHPDAFSLQVFEAVVSRRGWTSEAPFYQQTFDPETDTVHTPDRWRHDHIYSRGFYVRTADARAHLWKRYGLNILHLQAYEQAIGPNSGSLITTETSNKALEYFGKHPTGRGLLARAAEYAPFLEPWEADALPHDPTGEDYTELNLLAVIIGHMERQLFDFLRGVDVSRLSHRNPTLPCGIDFNLPGQAEEAFVFVADGPSMEAPSKNRNALPGGLEGANLQKLQRLHRLRSEIDAARREYGWLLEEQREHALAIENLYEECGIETAVEVPPVGSGGFYVRTPLSRIIALDDARLTALPMAQNMSPAEIRGALSDVQARVDGLQAAITQKLTEINEKITETRAAYMELVRVLAPLLEKWRAAVRRREQQIEIVASHERSWEKHKPHHVISPSVTGSLHPHFSFIPASVALLWKERDETTAHGTPAGAFLEITRPAHFNPKSGGAEAYRPLQINIPYQEDERNFVVKAAQSVFQEHRVQYLFPTFYVALNKLWMEAGAFDNPGLRMRTTLRDYLYTVLPPTRVERVKTKGLERGIIGPKDMDAETLFFAFSHVLDNLRLYRKDADGRETIMTAARMMNWEKNPRRPLDSWIEWTVNPSFLEYITGDRPMFMVNNTKALFSYSKHETYFSPLAQLDLELLLRTQFFKPYNKRQSVISADNGGGIKLTRLAYRWGINRGQNETRKDIVNRLNRILDNLQSEGVIINLERDGAERPNPLDTAYVIHMNPAYAERYNLGHHRSKLRKIESELAKPFAPPRRGKGA
jgi:hypothetical protein